MSSPARYAARIRLPDLIERGQATTLSCPIYRAGYVATPDSGTCSVYDQGGRLVATGDVDVVDGIATYELAAQTSAYAEGWRVEWTLVMADGARVRARNEAMLVRCVPIGRITEQDLYATARALDPTTPEPLFARTDYSVEIEESEVRIAQHLIRQGRRPWMIVDPSALRTALVLQTLVIVFQDLATRMGREHAETAKDYARQLEAELAQVQLRYLPDEQDVAGKTTAGISGGAYWMMGR